MAQFILGIDAAWTAHHPAGVALVRMSSRRQPQLLRVARSYEEFCNLSSEARIDWTTKVSGTPPDISALLMICEKITGHWPNVVALDIPIGPKPIIGRRTADNTVTRLYISRRAGTHTPSAQRPGPISQMLFDQLTACGFQWLHANVAPMHHKNSHVFVEAYPHPAVIELLNLDERLKYKVSKLQKYWPELEQPARWTNVVQQLDRLRTALNRQIKDVRKWLPPATALVKNGRTSRLKGYEDALDSIVCAWIGCEFLADRCVAYGDADSAIWLPKPRST